MATIGQDMAMPSGQEVSKAFDPRTANWMQRGLQALAVAEVVMLLLALIERDVEGYWWNVVVWLVLLAVTVFAVLVKPALQLALTAGLVLLTLRWAPATIVDVLPNSPIFEGEAPRRLLLFLVAILAVAGCAACFAHLRPLLLGAPRRGSFGIDVTFLVAAFVVLAAITANSEFGSLEFLGADWGQTRNLAWLIPLALWLALTCRQGGALAVGSAAGLVVACVLPLLGFAFFVGIQNGAGLDLGTRSGTGLAMAAVAIALLAVSIWWVLSPQVVPPTGRLAPDAGAPINSMSVVAFISAWFPFTAIPGIVLGHMAYDQVAGATAAQRGLGLARWAIVFGYLSLAGAVILYLQVFA